MIRSVRTNRQRAIAAVLATAGAALAVHFPAQPAGAVPDLVAFPGAEGFGAAATGGRGGDVVIVDTLEPFASGQHHVVDAPLSRLPLFARHGAHVPVAEWPTDAAHVLPHELPVARERVFG